jgi:glycine cleavage system H lipoate-binding protein
MDDFVRKMIGRIDAIELPARGAAIKKGDRLFTIRQGGRTAVFFAPISGVVQDVNADLTHQLEWLATRPYERGWVCSMKPAHLAEELGQLKIGEAAAAWYQEEIARLQQLLGSAQGNGLLIDQLAEGQLEQVDDSTWTKFTQTFLRV